jgi:hypothetical protein
MYTKTAIVNFIDKVRASCADAQRRMPPQATMVVLDTDDVRNWRNRELPPAARTRRHFIGSQLALAA